jgi:hypothetical protein
MKPRVKFRNLQSRLLLRPILRRQSVVPGPPPAGVERFLKWYERRVLKPDFSGIEVDRPVFLVGLPRSGTSMLQDIICSHPDVAYFTNTMHQFRSSFLAAEDLRRRLKLDFEAERYLEDDVLISPGSPSEAIGFWGKWFHGNPSSLDYRELRPEDISAEDIEMIKVTICKVLWHFGGRGKRFFSKLLGFFPHIGIINKIFPDARIIHILRDARTAAHSLLKLYRREVEHQARTGTRRFIPYPRFPRLAEYARLYGLDDIRTAAHLWDDAVSFAGRMKNELPHFFEVRYEDICANPNRALVSLLEFCELAPVGEEGRSFWKKISEVKPLRPDNAYPHAEIIVEICRENLRRHGYLS